ncbi:MAG TPA: 1-deoxy-D-xylulose-5-phosphate reductoisomerase [Acidimicrobiales bacterium]|nr:1-deoxy-D-xylulose-5-phosphate reductoisomerase [Acidimicrobiales bacterium]
MTSAAPPCPPPAATPRSLSILGSTGSIGRQAVEVVGAAPERFRVVALAGLRSVKLLAEQAAALRPELVVVADPEAAAELGPMLPRGIELATGTEGLAAAAELAEVVLNGVVGFAGLPVTVAALRAGRRLALANKESLIAGAPVVQRARATPGAELVPVDSEHCAVHQCLAERQASPARGLEGARLVVAHHELRRIVLTASGGPFRGRRAAELAGVTVAEALAHPTWQMGPKITVDSSTLMNKGLEVIEAHELFGVGYEQIAVVVHPQSVVHSMVEWCDGATIAQLSMPDMRLPIGYALNYPQRLGQPFGTLDWSRACRLDFEPPDLDTFVCLRLAYEAGQAGGSAPAWLSAANEVAVAAFLEGRIEWRAIAEVVADALEAHRPSELAEVGDVLEADAAARSVAGAAVARRELR